MSGQKKTKQTKITNFRKKKGAKVRRQPVSLFSWTAEENARD